jgi:RNA polymerase sigma-70 factor, ECF subfamily
LYRIAANACLSALEGRARRPLPSGLGAASGDPRAPLTPAVPLWYRGSRDYGLFMRRVFEMRGPGWVMRYLTANGQPALAAYAPEPHSGHLQHSLQVLTVTGGRVARNVVFAGPGVFEAFGLPGQIPAEQSRRPR